MKVILCGLKINKIFYVLVNKFRDNFSSKAFVLGELSLLSGMLNDALMHRWGSKG